MKWLAEHSVTFVATDGKRWRSRIAIAEPEQRTTGEWGCRIIAEGVVRIPGPIFGASKLQALVLALQFLAWELHRFIEQGGKALEPGDESDTRLDLIFGKLWRAIPTPAPYG